MTFSIGTVISIGISLIVGTATITFGIMNLKRNSKKDIQGEASQLTTITVKLDGIVITLAELKSDLSTQRLDIKELYQGYIRHEESLKSAHKRIDELTKEINSQKSA